MSLTGGAAPIEPFIHHVASNCKHLRDQRADHAQRLWEALHAEARTCSLQFRMFRLCCKWNCSQARFDKVKSQNIACPAGSSCCPTTSSVTLKWSVGGSFHVDLCSIGDERERKNGFLTIQQMPTQVLPSSGLFRGAAVTLSG